MRIYVNGLNAWKLQIFSCKNLFDLVSLCPMEVIPNGTQ